MLLETSRDNIDKIFDEESFVLELNVNVRPRILAVVDEDEYTIRMMGRRYFRESRMWRDYFRIPSQPLVRNLLEFLSTFLDIEIVLILPWVCILAEVMGEAGIWHLKRHVEGEIELCKGIDPGTSDWQLSCMAGLLQSLRMAPVIDEGNTRCSDTHAGTSAANTTSSYC
ncbi:hypothetical protein Tco_0550242 [Tanacetum coccineum]